MADREERLYELTGKGQYEDNTHRVYHTLTDPPHENLTQHKIAFVLSALIERLIENDLLTEEELDTILLHSRG